MGWLNAAGNIILAFFVAYLTTVGIYALETGFVLDGNSSATTTIGGVIFMIVFGCSVAVIRYRKTLLFEAPVINVNTGKVMMSRYAEITSLLMLGVIVLAVLGIAINAATAGSDSGGSEGAIAFLVVIALLAGVPLYVVMKKYDKG